MVSTAERPSNVPGDESAETVEGTGERAGTPVAVWILYVLGIASAVILTTSLVFAIVVAAADDSGLDFELSAAFIVWLALIVAALSTWIWRRFGRRP